MPLIIITGLPSSGKTHRARQIHDYISYRLSQDAPNIKRTVSVVGSHHASQDATEPTRLRDEIYTSSAREKTARAEEFSAIKRGVSRDNVVIADCPNYIKGYRYQLWCEAKAASTRCCVVHVASTEEESKRWNEGRLRAHSRSEEIHEQPPDKNVDVTKHGKDVRGDLVPESHTAIYGDRLPERPSRSRSSSMDAMDEPVERLQADDTMTLKSLYISSAAEREGQHHTVPVNGLSPRSPESYLPKHDPPPDTASPPYAPSTLTSLTMRYEPPSPFSRWDTPLFTIPTNDAHPPYSSIFDAIFPPPAQPTSKKALSQLAASARSSTVTTNHGPPMITPSTQSATAAADQVKAHAATVLPASTSASALQLLESSTLLVVRNLLTAARAASAADGDGGTVSFSVPLSSSVSSPATSTSTSASAEAEAEAGEGAQSALQLELEIPPGVNLSQPMLQRLRRKYTQLQRGRIAHGQGYVGQTGTLDQRKEEVVLGFARFLGEEFAVE